MVTFGQKLKKSAVKFGQKIDKGSHTMGRKINNTLTRADNAIANTDVAIRKIDHTIDRVQALGGNNVPGLGQALMAGSMAIKSARVGSKMAKDISKQTRANADELEKFNARKYANQALQESAGNGYV